MIRRHPIPAHIKPLWFYDSDVDLKKHPAYQKAKAGDGEAALKLIVDLVLEDFAAHYSRFDENCIFVAPFAREASGDNAIPQVFAELAAIICGAVADQDIVQVTRVYHTGADPMERLALRPTFDGVVKSGGHYVLVDDVLSLGGTLAELADYIQEKGGVVKDMLLLVNAGRNQSIHPNKSQLRILNERYAHDIENIFGIAVDALTANEAGYLVGFRSADEIRNRLVKAKQEINLRLRSKGIEGVFG